MQLGLKCRPAPQIVHKYMYERHFFSYETLNIILDNYNLINFELIFVSFIMILKLKSKIQENYNKL